MLILKIKNLRVNFHNIYLFIYLKVILLFIKNTLKWSKVSVKAFKVCFKRFKLSIYTLKNSEKMYQFPQKY